MTGRPRPRYRVHLSYELSLYPRSRFLTDSGRVQGRSTLVGQVVTRDALNYESGRKAIEAGIALSASRRPGALQPRGAAKCYSDRAERPKTLDPPSG